MFECVIIRIAFINEMLVRAPLTFVSRHQEMVKFKKAIRTVTHAAKLGEYLWIPNNFTNISYRFMYFGTELHKRTILPLFPELQFGRGRWGAISEREREREEREREREMAEDRITAETECWKLMKLIGEMLVFFSLVFAFFFFCFLIHKRTS